MPHVALAGIIPAIVGFLTSPIAAAILVGVSIYQRRRQRRRSRGERPRAETTVRSAIEPAQWRLGTTRYFGTLSQIAWSGDKLQMTQLLGEAPLQAINRIWVDGVGLDVAAGHRSFLSLTSDTLFGDGGNDVAMEIDFRLSGGRADTTRMRAPPWDTADGHLWTLDMETQGLAFVVIYLYQNSSGSWWRGVPSIEVQSTGYRWTPSGEAAVVPRNAAVARRWWVVEREGEPASRLDAVSYAAAVAVCTAADYEINGTVSSIDDPDSVRDAFDLAWDGAVVDFNGGLRFLPGTARTQLFTIPDDDLIDLPTIRPVRDLAERINQVELQLLQSRTADAAEHAMPPIIDTAAQTRDGGQLSTDWGVVEYITDPVVAVNVAARSLVESQGLQVEIRVPYGTDTDADRYLGLAPGSIVGLERPGLTGKRFRVDTTGPGEDETLILGLTEELADRYTRLGPTVPGVTIPEVTTSPELGAPEGLVFSPSTPTMATVRWLVSRFSPTTGWHLRIDGYDAPLGSTYTQADQVRDGRLDPLTLSHDFTTRPSWYYRIQLTRIISADLSSNTAILDGQALSDAESGERPTGLRWIRVSNLIYAINWDAWAGSTPIIGWHITVVERATRAAVGTEILSVDLPRVVPGGTNLYTALGSIPVKGNYYYTITLVARLTATTNSLPLTLSAQADLILWPSLQLQMLTSTTARLSWEYADTDNTAWWQLSIRSQTTRLRVAPETGTITLAPTQLDKALRQYDFVTQAGLYYLVVLRRRLLTGRYAVPAVGLIGQAPAVLVGRTPTGLSRTWVWSGGRVTGMRLTWDAWPTAGDQPLGWALSVWESYSTETNGAEIVDVAPDLTILSHDLVIRPEYSYTVHLSARLTATVQGPLTTLVSRAPG